LLWKVFVDQFSVATYVPPTSWSSQVSTLAHKPTTFRTIGIAAASTASYALLNCLCAASLGRHYRPSHFPSSLTFVLGAHNWHLFAPTKRHALNLNESVLILMLGNALVGATLATKDLLTNRAVVKWPSKIVSIRMSRYSSTRTHIVPSWTVSESTIYPQPRLPLVHHRLPYPCRAFGIYTVHIWVLDVSETCIPCSDAITPSWAVLQVGSSPSSHSTELTHTQTIHNPSSPTKHLHSLLQPLSASHGPLGDHSDTLRACPGLLR
jgi:hypothetical protein